MFPKYKGTRMSVRIGDKVKVSNRWVGQQGWNDTIPVYGIIVALDDFIKVNVDGIGTVSFDARQLTFIRRPNPIA